MRKIIIIILLVTILSGIGFLLFINQKFREPTSTKYVTLGTSVTLKMQPQVFSKADADYLMLDTISFEDSQVVFTVKDGITKVHESLPAYFTDAFSGRQVSIDLKADVKKYRFKPIGKLDEMGAYKNFGFLYAFPSMDYKNGVYEYRFVYLAEITPDRVQLRTLDGGVSERSLSPTWTNFKVYNFTKEDSQSPSTQ